MNVIRAEDVSKVYRLYDKPINRLREIVLRRPFHREFVAIDGLSFGVEKGETLGIIGENGAGKSTLLKLLSGTLAPTRGILEVKGTVSSLLELGSGFHPEFTGIDNIHFYGSLIGIDRQRMQAKVAEIIEFSELGEFINYPVKTYSSGMFVRLAFSVATAVDPDILIIDEVLSVGDLHFQKKSTDRILSFKEKGKTMVFCSHEMYHVARICDRVLWLKNGRIEMEGGPFEVIQEYETYQLSKGSSGAGGALGHLPDLSGVAAAPSAEPGEGGGGERPLVYIREVQVYPSQVVRTGDDVYVRASIAATDPAVPYRAAVVIKTMDGHYILGVGTDKIPPFHGDKTVTLMFPKIQLKSGTFIFEAFAFDEEGVYVFDKKEALPLKVPRESIEIGIVDLPHQWIVD
ncbi:MAG: ABC transporter ATP-binding protein [Chloroflexota bacterium]